MVLSPTFSLEAFEEQRALQNLRSEDAGTTRHARCSAVNVMSRRDLKVSSLNVGRTQPVINTIHDRTGSDSLDPLTRANPTDLALLERGQKPGKNCSWPRDIVVCHHSHGSLDFWDGFADLNALVCNRNMEHAEIGGLQRLCKVEEFLVLVCCCNEQEFGGVANENALKRFLELLKIMMDGWNYDRDIFGRKGGTGRFRDRLV